MEIASVCTAPGCFICAANARKAQSMYMAEVPGTPRDSGDVEWFTPTEHKDYTDQFKVVGKTIMFAQPDVYKLRLIQAKPPPTQDDKAIHNAIGRNTRAFSRQNSVGWTPDWDE